VHCFVLGHVWCIVLFLVVIGALFCFFNKSMSDEFEKRLYRYVSLNDGDIFREMRR